MKNGPVNGDRREAGAAQLSLYTDELARCKLARDNRAGIASFRGSIG